MSGFMLGEAVRGNVLGEDNGEVVSGQDVPGDIVGDVVVLGVHVCGRDTRRSGCAG